MARSALETPTFGGPSNEDPLMLGGGITSAMGGGGALGALAPAPEQRNPEMSEMPPDIMLSPDDLAMQGDADMMVQQPVPIAFNDNLALHLPPHTLTALGQEIVQMVDADVESQKPWEQRFKRGLEMIGLKDFTWDDGAALFEGAATVVHPGLAEAGVESQARAVEQLMPAKGPAKTLVMGVETDETDEAATRVSDHMNYQLMVEDPVYAQETNKLHLYKTWFGCAYRKAYHDPLTGRNVLRLVKGEDLILPYDSTSLQTAGRATHRYPLTKNDFKRYVRAKEFRDVDIPEPGEPEPTTSEEENAKIDGKDAIRADNDTVYTIYETDVSLTIKGFEDPDGIDLPYTVCVEKESETVLSIYRNYKESDPLQIPRVRYAQYDYVPGLGSRGYGLLHLIGSLSEAATGTLRALLDAAAFATAQGGFKAKDAGVEGGEIGITPGVWKDIDLTSDELNKAFFTPPFKEPSAALFQVLQFLTELIRRFAGTVDVNMGEGNNTGPVGTTVALIEQGQTLYSAVHKRGHTAVGVELRMLFELNAEHIPAEGYSYKVPGDSLAVYKADYNENIVSVVPISDPNIFSQTQRIAQNQATYQLMKENETSFKKYKVLKRTLEGLKVPDPDDLLIDPEDIPMMDAVTENAAIMTGRPVTVHPEDQDLAHMAVHMSFAQHPQFGGLPQAQQVIMPAFLAHMAQHLASYYVKVNQGMGVPVPQANFARGPGEGLSDQQMSPDQANAITMQAAQMIGQFMQTSGLSIPPGNGNDDKKNEADIRLTDAQAFAAFGTGAAALAKAVTSVQQGEQELAGLSTALDGGEAGAGAAPQPRASQPGGAIAAPQPAQPQPAPQTPAAPVTVNVHPPQGDNPGALG